MIILREYSLIFIIGQYHRKQFSLPLRAKQIGAVVGIDNDGLLIYADCFSTHIYRTRIRQAGALCIAALLHPAFRFFCSHYAILFYNSIHNLHISYAD